MSAPKISGPGEGTLTSTADGTPALARARDVDSTSPTRPAEPPYTRASHVARIDRDEQLLATVREFDRRASERAAREAWLADVIREAYARAAAEGCGRRYVLGYIEGAAASALPYDEHQALEALLDGPATAGQVADVAEATGRRAIGRVV